MIHNLQEFPSDIVAAKCLAVGWKMITGNSIQKP